MSKRSRVNIKRLKTGKRATAVRLMLRPRTPMVKLAILRKAGPHSHSQNTIRQSEQRRLREECAQLKETP